MSKDLASLTLGYKLILLFAGHISMNTVIIAAGKEVAFEFVPALKVFYAEDLIKEFFEIMIISINTFPLTAAAALIMANYEKDLKSYIPASSAALWFSMFLGSWLHLGINSEQLSTNGIVSLHDYLNKGFVYLQVLTYPVVVFFKTYGFIMFLTSVMVGFYCGSHFWRKEE